MAGACSYRGGWGEMTEGAARRVEGEKQEEERWELSKSLALSP